LYVEDEPNDAQLVDRYIRVTNHKLKIVNNISDAEASMNTSPDLIMVDVVLGTSREGYTFVRQLRQNGYEQPIIAVTGLTLPDDIERCFESGCTEVLSKPYTIDQLDNLLKKYNM